MPGTRQTHGLGNPRLSPELAEVEGSVGVRVERWRGQWNRALGCSGSPVGERSSRGHVGRSQPRARPQPSLHQRCSSFSSVGHREWHLGGHQVRNPCQVPEVRPSRPGERQVLCLQGAGNEPVRHERPLGAQRAHRPAGQARYRVRQRGAREAGWATSIRGNGPRGAGWEPLLVPDPFNTS